ncbi:hypothetical protein GC176_17020 [bacterium]|nr:hypothetical protein [bacterium]
MWCNVCQSDVAIEVGADHRRVTCSTCGTVLGETAVSRETERRPAGPQGDRVTEARDLLDRWASNHLFDPHGPPKKPVSDEQLADATSTPRRPRDSAASAGPAARQSSSAHDAEAEAASQTALPERLEDVLETPQPGVRPRWDAPHTMVRRPMNLERRDEGRRGSRPADNATGGVAESARRRQPPPSAQRPAQPATGSPRAESPGVEPSGETDLATIAAELDRLTNEILARVSRIADRRATEPTAPQQPAEQPSNQAAQSDPAGDAYGNDDDHDTSVGDVLTDDELPTEAADAWNLAPASYPAEPGTDDEPESEFNDEDYSATNNGADDAEPATQRHVPRPHAAAFTQRVDAPHRVAEPHADFSYGRNSAPVSVTSDEEEDSASWFGGIGQGLAWLGILGLTAGTSLVIVGYFGGPATYAPMGWLISTIGQMLLFLGIVTLVSSGMEQTTQEVRRTVNEVSRKLDLIDDRIMRIDAAEPPGPPRPHIADRMVKATIEQRIREDAARR